MTWATPPVFADGNLLTAAQLNTISNDLLETAAAKATTAGYHFASTGANSIAERAILAAAVDTAETTTSTSYVDLATPGPSVTLTTGPRALIWINCQITNSGTLSTFASYGTSGASTNAASDNLAVTADPAAGASQMRGGVCDLRGLTAGTNSFFMNYRVAGGTGTFTRRRIQVLGL